MFYGLPIHIMRDLFMTGRSFAKRLTAFLRYRRATQDMNKRYEDATVEDIQREDTCIICREEMRPWSVTNPQAPAAGPGALPPARQAATVNERSRPKKLPCGHILHLGCLKSWLERQQVCPTCRRSVVDNEQPPRGAANNANPAGQGNQPPAPGQQDGPGAPPAGGRGAGHGMRMLNLGPLRVGFGQANLQDLAQGLGGPQQAQENAVAGGPRVYGLELGFPRRVQPQPQAQGTANLTGTNTLQDTLHQIEHQIVAEIRSLQVAQQELQLVELLQAELTRLRLMQAGATDPLTANFQMPQMPQLRPLNARHTHAAPFFNAVPHLQRHRSRPNGSAIPAGSADLPPGVTIPEGWSLLPLQRLDDTSVTQAGTVPVSGPATNAGLAPTATTTQTVNSPMTGTSNNTPTPTPTTHAENHSQASSVDSSDTNAIHTPPSVTADQSISTVSNTTIPSTTTTSNVPASSTPANPSTFPDWATQLFSGPSLTGNSINTSASLAPPPSSVQEQPPTYAIASSGLNEASSDDISEERMRDKGKAKAATVEDTIDEAEGA
jgi:E3 ubiquitin-protein ligase synoviolin